MGVCSISCQVNSLALTKLLFTCKHYDNVAVIALVPQVKCVLISTL